ncbi:MAG: SUMF1/EgtB/PvdO family nonheme iron enzyme [Myxococcales bacterium]|nr:SUMF1/EgtB/PvdO family nonheme iron enzyme [Myxococcales bacterium]MCB9576277.1 SUMF1/EgtB/PvdO family nonheme iron enzyme [Polyangiaceae bacterium]
MPRGRLLLLLALAGCDDSAPLRAELPLQVAHASTVGRAPPPAARRCPSDMVDVAGRFCVDRFETSLTGIAAGRQLSPYYNPTPLLAERDHHLWEYQAPRMGSTAARETPLPELPAWQLAPGVKYRAESKRGRIPNAYLDLDNAREACANAGKRLCTHEEWLMACRGQAGTRHPYGEHYEPGRCNVARPLHPGGVLHGKTAGGYLDPRLSQVKLHGKPLLERSGERVACKSVWGDDAVYDMVGNLDEWIDDPGGTFLGGFYARDTAYGCDMRVTVHSADYYDYSIGARCCR